MMRPELATPLRPRVLTVDWSTDIVPRGDEITEQQCVWDGQQIRRQHIKATVLVLVYTRLHYQSSQVSGS